MALKREVTSLDEVPEALRTAYVEKDGKFVLDVDGASDDGKLAGALEKERKARADAEKSLKDLKTKLGDLDPAKAREALQMIADLEAKALLGDLPPAIAAKVEEAVSKRTERMAVEAKAEREKLAGDNRTLSTRLEELLIDNSIRTAATKAGVKLTAVDDTVLYGKTVWRLKDGVPVPMKGEEVLYGKEANKPLTMDEWISERAKDRPHWFEPSNGGGAAGSGARVTGNAVTLARDQAKNPAAYRAAKEQAAKAGVELVIQ